MFYELTTRSAFSFPCLVLVDVCLTWVLIGPKRSPDNVLKAIRVYSESFGASTKDFVMKLVSWFRPSWSGLETMLTGGKQWSRKDWKRMEWCFPTLMVADMTSMIPPGCNISRNHGGSLPTCLVFIKCSAGYVGKIMLTVPLVEKKPNTASTTRLL